jgi:hypothetical protein
MGRRLTLLELMPALERVLELVVILIINSGDDAVVISHGERYGCPLE